ncbi:MAG: hypothetical protein ABEJ46_05880, partial [Gemmatimonadota bacterium]
MESSERRSGSTRGETVELDFEASRARGGGNGPPEGLSVEDERPVPARALVVSLLALAVAAAVGSLWPDAARDYSGLVWLLALVPVFLLSYYRGWQGATLATLLSMVALTGAEVVLVDLLGRPVEWRTFGFATVI